MMPTYSFFKVLEQVNKNQKGLSLFYLDIRIKTLSIHLSIDCFSIGKTMTNNKIEYKQNVNIVWLCNIAYVICIVLLIVPNLKI